MNRNAADKIISDNIYKKPLQPSISDTCLIELNNKDLSFNRSNRIRK